MKKIYENVYFMLINTNLNIKSREGQHCHRIQPGYNGGEYVEDNVVYLTQAEHSLIHWLRWKLYGDIRDKRSYKMIGKGPSGLSLADRVAHGKQCHEDSIGFHNATPDERLEWSLRGITTQKDQYEKTGKKNFYYWSTKQGQRERAGMGGKASCKTNEAFINQQGSFRDKEKAALHGAKAAKKPVHNCEGIIRKLKTEDEVLNFLKLNPTWKKGTGISPMKGKKQGPSSQRKPVTDGNTIFDSVLQAALHCGVSSATIINWCKSFEKQGWKYV